MIAVTLLHAYAWLAMVGVIFLAFLKLGDWLADRGWL